MAAHGRTSYPGAGDFLPPSPKSLSVLSEAAAECRGCDLYRRATQTVFGSGEVSARLVLIGEQPGNDEDRAGKPFVGPAGRLLDTALEAAGIERRDAYVTNAVKHFNWEARGKLRLHKRPGAREIKACSPWLEQEFELIRPALVVCLGAIAARAVFGRDMRIGEQRGTRLSTERLDRVLITAHPSSILRARAEDDRASQMQAFVNDLRAAARWLGEA